MATAGPRRICPKLRHEGRAGAGLTAHVGDSLALAVTRQWPSWGRLDCAAHRPAGVKPQYCSVKTVGAVPPRLPVAKEIAVAPLPQRKANTICSSPRLRGLLSSSVNWFAASRGLRKNSRSQRTGPAPSLSSTAPCVASENSVIGWMHIVTPGRYL